MVFTLIIGVTFSKNVNLKRFLTKFFLFVFSAFDYISCFVVVVLLLSKFFSDKKNQFYSFFILFFFFNLKSKTKRVKKNLLKKNFVRYKFKKIYVRFIIKKNINS